MKDARGGFIAERGAKIGEDDGALVYAMTFAISGMTQCRILVAPIMPWANCVAYDGNDADVAPALYRSLQRQLHDFVGREKPLDVRTITSSASVVDQTEYGADRVDVTLKMTHVADSFHIEVTVAPVEAY